MHELPTGTVTLLFTDMEGSTRLLHLLGKRYAAVLAECRNLMRAAFQQHHGHEVDTQGDAFFVAFARATDPVSAAVTAQRALAGHPWPDQVPVRVRMGLHTGEPDLAPEGYVGLCVHHAARIMSAGHGGQVLLSHVTCDLVEHDLPEGVSLRDLGAHRLKDLRHPHHLFQLVIAGLAADFPPLKTLDSFPNNLPTQPTPFIGREKEVAAVQQHVLRDGVHLLTLTGPGGVGKTRLGLHVAAELTERFTDGTWFVSLAPLSDPALVLPTIAQTLGLREEGDRSPLDQLQISLQQKQVLLLLDNFEHVASAAPQVADLLGACPRLKVLATSREALHVRAEREFPVPALSLPDLKHLPDLVTLSQYEAVALFIERAQAVKPDFQMTNANAPTVAEICARLDGLPLAIELAAARIKLFPPQELLTRLSQRLQLLTSSLRDVPARQQTLRKTIQWSYDLLAAQEQRLFRRLSVFSGGCTLQAIEALSAQLLGASTPVLDEIASLIDKSLLQQSAPEGEELRLTMLETIREYGLEMLTTTGESDATRQAHASYYLQLSEEILPGLVGPEQAVLLKRLEREYANLRATMQWSLDQGEKGSGREMALRLAWALGDYWDARGLIREGRDFLEQALVGSEGVVAPIRAKALGATAGFVSMLGDTDRAEALCQESLVLYREVGDTQGIIFCLMLLAEIAKRKGAHLTTVRALLEERLALARQAGDKMSVAWALLDLAHLTCILGEYSKGAALFEESLALHRELGNTLGIAVCTRQSAMWLFWARGDQATIRARLEECLTLFRELGNKYGIGFYDWISGWIALSQGDADTAYALVEQSLELLREMGDRWSTIWVLAILGRIEAQRGNFAASRVFHEESLAQASAFRDHWTTAFCLEGLANTAAAQGEGVWAAHLWAAAECLRERNGAPLSPIERVDYEPAVAATRTLLGEEAFAAAWAEDGR
jgi:predicted ATPase/class 3 adenylate cyclase